MDTPLSTWDSPHGTLVLEVLKVLEDPKNIQDLTVLKVLTILKILNEGGSGVWVVASRFRFKMGQTLCLKKGLDGSRSDLSKKHVFSRVTVTDVVQMTPIGGTPP